MKTVAQITMQSGFVLELKSDHEVDAVGGSAAALRLIFPNAIPSARYEAMLQIVSAWNVLQQFASGEVEQGVGGLLTSSEKVPHSQGTPLGQSNSQPTGSSAPMPASLPSIRLDVEILKLIETMKPDALSKKGLMGLLRPAFPSALGNQIEDVLEALARLKWITLETRNGDFEFSLAERGLGALRMAKRLGY